MRDVRAWFIGVSLSLCLAPAYVQSKPVTEALCKRTFTPTSATEKVLKCVDQGGERATRELAGQQYLYDVGVCRDVDMVVLQKCGCRQFTRSSICCRKGMKQDCEWRVGDSKLVDCAPFGQPKFGTSGDVEPPDCKQTRNASDCFKRRDLVFTGAVVGPCRRAAPEFTCPDGRAAVSRFQNDECGPTPEDCGCTLIEECSEPEGLACYRAWKANPEALACTKKPQGSDRDDCFVRTMKK